MSLPKFVVFKSNHDNKYLRYIQEQTNAHLKFSGEEFVSPYVKFEVEKAKSGNGLVHIRCCYNNKYWSHDWESEYNWIVPRANEPDEDQSKKSCTLFKPIHVDNDAKTVQILHVHLGCDAKVRIAAAPHDSYLFAVSKNYDGIPMQGDVFKFIDWESLLIMPRHVAFKGNNGKYLCVKKSPYLQFASDDVGDPTVGNEIFTTHDGRIRVKSNHEGKFWRRSNSTNWIWADSGDTTNNDHDTLFWPVKFDNNVIALRNLGNKNFCKGLTIEGKRNYLSAGVVTTSKEAKITVEELVTSRHIYNVIFHPSDARIYSKKVHTMDAKDATNRNKTPKNEKLKFSYTETKSSSWNTIIWSKLGVKKTDFKPCVPFINDEGRIEISAELSEVKQWGKPRKSQPEVVNEYEVIVPPMTKVTVSLLATEGKCDVPFSYTQRDTLTNGKEVTYNMVDGIYSGINFFNFRYEIKHKKI